MKYCKLILITVLLSLVGHVFTLAQNNENKTVLCIVAHPDDAEFQCAGTLALLADKGWKIVIATMTPGQAGSAEKMLSCHKSQREWLLKISGVDDYVMTMREFSKKEGKEVKCNYAEGFRQHLGFSYPVSNILKSELGDLVIEHPFESK